MMTITNSAVNSGNTLDNTLPHNENLDELQGLDNEDWVVNWYKMLNNLPTFVEEVTVKWGNLKGEPINFVESLYLNKILQHEPGVKSFEEWLKIKIVYCRDEMTEDELEETDLGENLFNYQMSSNEIVDLLIQNNADDYRYDPGQSNTFIMSLGVEDITCYDVFKDYANDYAFFKAYSEANLN